MEEMAIQKQDVELVLGIGTVQLLQDPELLQSGLVPAAMTATRAEHGKYLPSSGMVLKVHVCGEKVLNKQALVHDSSGQFSNR